MKLSRKRKAEILETIATENNLSLAVVEAIIDQYADIVSGDIRSGLNEFHPIKTGVFTLDSFFSIHPGITVISGPHDSGKSSLAKAIARFCQQQDLTVLYADCDCKFINRDFEDIRGALYTKGTEAQAIHQLFKARLIDVLVIDTVTAMLPQSQNYIIHHARKAVPYIIIVSQMRWDMEQNRMVPACNDRIMSLAHTHLTIDSCETIHIETLDMARVVGRVIKSYTDSVLSKYTTAWVVKDHRVNNQLTAYDLLSVSGKLKSIGPIRYYNDSPIGTLEEVYKSRDLSVLEHALEFIGMKGDRNAYM